jgi:hypothetical protein
MAQDADAHQETNGQGKQPDTSYEDRHYRDLVTGRHGRRLGGRNRCSAARCRNVSSMTGGDSMGFAAHCDLASPNSSHTDDDDKDDDGQQYYGRYQ